MKLFKPMFLDTPDFTFKRTWWGNCTFIFKTPIYELDFIKVRDYFIWTDIYINQRWELLEKHTTEKQ